MKHLVESSANHVRMGDGHDSGFGFRYLSKTKTKNKWKKENNFNFSGYRPGRAVPYGRKTWKKKSKNRNACGTELRQFGNGPAKPEKLNALCQLDELFHSTFSQMACEMFNECVNFLMFEWGVECWIVEDVGGWGCGERDRGDLWSARWTGRTAKPKSVWRLNVCLTRGWRAVWLRRLRYWISNHRVMIMMIYFKRFMTAVYINVWEKALKWFIIISVGFWVMFRLLLHHSLFHRQNWLVARDWMTSNNSSVDGSCHISWL